MAIRTTAILNLKGGVAKTTTAINMAAILAKEHNSAAGIDYRKFVTEYVGGK